MVSIPLDRRSKVYYVSLLRFTVTLNCDGTVFQIPFVVISSLPVFVFSPFRKFASQVAAACTALAIRARQVTVW